MAAADKIGKQGVQGENSFEHNEQVIQKALAAFETAARRIMAERGSGAVGIRVPFNRGKFGRVRTTLEVDEQNGDGE